MTAITLGVAELGQKLEWESISGAVNRLFELKRYPELAHRLHELNEKVRAISKSELGQFIGEYYLDHILAPCMEKLGSELAGETGAGLVSKLTDIWTQFYTSILPTLLAIFASVQVSVCVYPALKLCHNVAFHSTSRTSCQYVPSRCLASEIKFYSEDK